ncbi:MULTISPECIES: glycosyltransferase family protein [Pseudomonas]|jgi:glycosyltransferase involved in cell wall biosynthesis|uniref:Glycosyltransferase family 1 protein n=1 Tax=Pseudomonas kielensis TaxID=2762577 RepID=A0A7X1KVR5_9PSED|nr:MULTISPECIES: glycosyltransferase [Pseudomonas]MBC2688432.1 glycosyltransferase family 1 protein [Pseudomonas kielensis]NBB36128.1 glycosyltransferase [Pseudomonas sp. BC115LW]UZM13503.1 glycosyltransferase [Pseudomonas kielensis]WKL54488.1 glycosyltransferase [Pseudomonas kielensis]
MKVLFLVQKEQRAILDRLYEGVADHCECDLRWLSSDEQRNLRRYFRREVDVTRYDRIVFFLRFKQEIRQASFIRTIPNLVILEHDAYQNYIPCKYTGKFSAHYRRLPWARVISSGFVVAERLRQEGFDAVFVPKGYDQSLLQDQGRERDIELAFVGSTNSVAYSGRKALLDELASVEPLVVTRTKSGDEYRDTLNRIRFFVSADVGMGEFMIKNFEAMACGCVLLAFDQGEAESRALGLQDMHNIVFYRDIAQLQEKLALLRADPGLAASIARNGRDLAVSQFSFARVGQRIVEELQPPLRPRADLSLVERLRLKLGI